MPIDPVTGAALPYDGAAPARAASRTPYAKGAPPIGLSKPSAPMAGGTFGMRPPRAAPGPWGAMSKAPASVGAAPAFAGPRAGTGLQQLQSQALARATRR